MEQFVDTLIARMTARQSVLAAGIDPIIEKLPGFILDKATRETKTDDEFIYQVLTETFIPSLEALAPLVAACKINIAFFEQYGLAGLRAFSDLLKASKRESLPSIADGKRSDIGSTAEAYASAYLGGSQLNGRRISAFETDALTISPYLGSDSLEPFVRVAKKNGKGLFVLVRTSNPGSHWIQKVGNGSGDPSHRVAEWIDSMSAELLGRSGFSSLGAVIGATYPEEAREFRRLMPRSFFLIPGYGAQGGTAKDAAAGFASNNLDGCASLINVSRGLFGVFAENLSNIEMMQTALRKKASELNGQLASELA